MKAYARWTDQAIKNMQRGLELKNTNPKAAMVKVLAQLRPLYEKGAEDNILYRPMRNFPEEMDSITIKQLTTDYSQALETYLIPA